MQFNYATKYLALSDAYQEIKCSYPLHCGLSELLDIYNKFLDFPVSNKNFGRQKFQSRSAMKILCMEVKRTQCRSP